MTSPEKARHARKEVNAARTDAVSNLTTLLKSPIERKVPMRNSDMTMNLARRELKSNPVNPNENIYNSKLSIEKSFETAERINTPPTIILMTFFKTTHCSLHSRLKQDW